MYRYVSNNDSRVKKYRKECMTLLTAVQKELKKSFGLYVGIVMIGSGSRKLITRNGNGPFDLDYNLTVSKLPDEFDKNPQKLKDFVRSRLDFLIKENKLSYAPGNDSTSVITYIRHNEDGKEVFSFDLGIIAKRSSNKDWYRLLYIKKQNSYIWEPQRNSNKLESRANRIRHQDKYDLVKNIYLDKKNKALTNQERISSYSLYVSTINEVEQQLNGRKFQ